MSRVSVGVCAVLAAALFANLVQAAPANRAGQADSVVGSQNNQSTAINDHAGAFIPNRGSDRDFEFNPDGDDERLGSQGDADRDGDGNDEEIYQGEDDLLPA